MKSSRFQQSKKFTLKLNYEIGVSMVTILKKLLILFCLFFSLFGTNAMSLRNSLDKLATSLNNLTASLQKQMPTRMPLSTTGTSMPPRRIVLPPPTHIQLREGSSASSEKPKSSMSSTRPGTHIFLTPEGNVPSKEDIKQAEREFPLPDQKQEESTSDDQMPVLRVEVGQEGSEQTFDLTRRDIEASKVLDDMYKGVEEIEGGPSSAQEELQSVPLLGKGTTPRAFEKWLHFIQIARTPGIDMNDILDEYLNAKMEPQFLFELIHTANHLYSKQALAFFNRLFGYYLTQAALDPQEWVEYEKILDELPIEMVQEIAQMSNTLALWEDFAEQDAGNVDPFKRYAGEGEVNASQVSSEGNWVAMISQEANSTSLCNFKKDTRHQLKNPHGQARTLSFSPDSKLLAIGGGSQTTGGGWVCVWNVADRKLLYTLAHNRGLLAVVFAPGEPTKAADYKLLTLASDNVARVWSLNSATPSTGAQPTFSFTTEAVKLAIINQAGTHIAVATFSDKIYLLDATTGTTIKSWETQYPGISTILFSPNGELLAAISNQGFDSLLLFLKMSEEKTYKFDSLGAMVDIVFSPDSKKALVEARHDILVFELNTDITQSKSFGKKGGNLCYSPHGTFIALSQYASIQLINALTYKILLTLTSGNDVKRLFFPDEKYLIAQSRYDIAVWEVGSLITRQKIIQDITSLDQIALIRLAAIQRRNKKKFKVPQHLKNAYENLPENIKKVFDLAIGLS